MKRILFSRLSSVLVLLLVSISIARSQTNLPPRRLEVGPPSGVDGRLLQMQDRIIVNILTEEQRLSFREALQAQRDKIREIEPKLVAARKELFSISAAEKFDEKAVRAQAMIVGKLEAEMAVLRARALSQIKPPLTAEQIERMQNFSSGMDLPVHPRRGGEVGSSIRPQQRSAQRDENDLPMSGKP